MSEREDLGRIVRDTWVAWAQGQPDPKPSWLTGWDELDDGQREVDMRIGEAVAAAVRADTPPRRDPASATHGSFDKRGEPVTHQQPDRYQAQGRPFGFGPPAVTA